MLTKTLRLVFGVLMIIVYLGMAYLLIVNFFEWTDTAMWRMIRLGMAAILAAYGVYRAYRQVKGTDYYRNRQLEDRMRR